MGQPKLLADAIGQPLKAAGFKRKADTWYLDNPDTISIVNLQKSDYGRQYYLNIAIWLKKLGFATAPKEYHCHVRCRWSALVPLHEKELARLLDLEDASLTDEERTSQIDSALRTYVIPFLRKTATLDGLRSIRGTDAWPSILVDRAAQELLGEHKV